MGFCFGEKGNCVTLIEHWIGGKRTAALSSPKSVVWNPATGQQQAEVLLASSADVAEAVGVAYAAFDSWSQASLSRRAKVLVATSRWPEQHHAADASYHFPTAT
jgi:acyl-CoA reductase-like NAD-dependent aldehyde dehydrogenase